MKRRKKSRGLKMQLETLRFTTGNFMIDYWIVCISYFMAWCIWGYMVLKFMFRCERKNYDFDDVFEFIVFLKSDKLDGRTKRQGLMIIAFMWILLYLGFHPI